MFGRYTERAQKAIGLAREEAHRLQWDTVDVGHLFLGLVREGNGLAAVALQNLGLELDRVRAEADRLIGVGSGTPRRGLEFTSRAIQLLLEETHAVSRQLGHNYAGTEHILLALLKDTDGIPARVLRQLGVSTEDVHALVLASVHSPVKAPPPHELPYTERLLRQVLPLATEEAQNLDDDHVGTEHLLLGILRFGQGRAADLLSRKGVTLEWVRAELKRTRALNKEG